MTAVFQTAVPGENYIFTVTLSNGNRMDIHMAPYLDCQELSPLKDKSV